MGKHIDRSAFFQMAIEGLGKYCTGEHGQVELPHYCNLIMSNLKYCDIAHGNTCLPIFIIFKYGIKDRQNEPNVGQNTL